MCCGRGLDRLEANGDFEAAGNASGEIQHNWADRAGVRLDRHPRKGMGKIRERRYVLGGHGAVVEEVAGVVQLQPVEVVEGLEVVEDLAKLSGERAGGSRAIERPAPQVAERARKWALGAGEENGERARDSAPRSPFILDRRTVRDPRIDAGLGRAQALDAAVVSGARGNGGGSAPRPLPRDVGRPP